MTQREGRSLLQRFLLGSETETELAVPVLPPNLAIVNERFASYPPAEEPTDYVEFTVVEQPEALPPLRPALADSVPYIANWMIGRAQVIYDDMQAGSIDPDLYPNHWVRTVEVLATIDDVTVPSYGFGDQQGRIY